MLRLVSQSDVIPNAPTAIRLNAPERRFLERILEMPINPMTTQELGAYVAMARDIIGDKSSAESRLMHTLMDSYSFGE